MKPHVTPRQTALIQQGIVLQQQRRFVEAERNYQAVLRENPKHPDALNLMGVLAIEADQTRIAIDYLRKALEILPNEPMYLNNLGNALIIASQHEEAFAHLRKAVKIAPRFAEAWSNLGKNHRMAGDIERARDCFEKALSAMPGFARARAGLAEIASETGRFEEAEAAFAGLLIDEPDNVEAMCGMAAVKKFSADDQFIPRLEMLVQRPGLRADQRAPLHHALAKVCNDVGRYDDAMNHFVMGKELKRLVFDAQLHSKTYAAQKAAFSVNFFAARQDFGIADERPVFIVGMPRSGTTLTEQYLSAHPDIEGMGELHDMRKIAKDLGYGGDDPNAFVKRVSALTTSDCANLAQTYMKGYAKARKQARRLVDKSPHNYELLGLIALLFPKAHIIHCSREPMDNCVAIFMQNFNEAHGYNKDFATLGQYYREYQGLMRHWRENLPLPIHENVYEEAVADFEPKAKAVVSFLGMPWNEACLNFHQLERQVRTPSRWQVRQPIYSTSIERWRRYEKHLGPLKAALGLTQLENR